MPTTRRYTSKITTRKGNLRNGAVLAISEAAKLVNLPPAHAIALHIKEVTVALKPLVFQVPKANNFSAQEREDHVIRLMKILDAALPHLSQTEELEQIYCLLREAHAELESILTSQYSTKFASQTLIRGRITQLKEEISQTVVDLTLRFLVVTLAENLHNRQRNRKAVMRTHKVTTQTRRTMAQTHRIVTRQRSALLRAEHEIVYSNKRIAVLEQTCEELLRQGGAHGYILMRYRDERRPYHGVRLSCTLLVFSALPTGKIPRYAA